MNPSIKTTVGGYEFTYLEHQVCFKVSRLHAHQDGRVTGELLILNKDNKPIYPQTSINFTADRTRNSLAKTLSEQDSTRPWSDLINHLTLTLIDLVRKGEPVKELWTGENITPPRYLLDPFIVENYPNVIFGDPSGAKSTIAIVLLQMLTLPWHDNPIGLTTLETSTTCLYGDWETDENTILWQTTMLQRGMGLPSLCVNYRHCALPLASDIEEIKHRIEDIKAKVFIIDSLGLASGGELSKTESPLAFFAALRQLKVTTLILAHNSKDQETKKRTILGSQLFTAQARNVWEVRKSQEAGSNEMHIALFHRKPPPFGKFHSPIGFKVSFGEDTMAIAPADPRNVREFLEQYGGQTRILDALKHQTMTAKELSEELDIKLNTVSQYLKRLANKTKVVKLDNGAWGLCDSHVTDE